VKNREEKRAFSGPTANGKKEGKISNSIHSKTGRTGELHVSIFCDGHTKRDENNNNGGGSKEKGRGGG